MSASQTIRIGFERRAMAGTMTGIGNYTFHLLSALTDRYPELRYLGFGATAWSPMGTDELQVLASSKNTERPALTSSGFGIRQMRQKLVQQLKRSDVAYKIYQSRFSRTARRQSLDLFHAFNFVPIADPGVTILPVVYDLSFVRYPDAHPPERLRRLDRLPAILARSPYVQTISAFSRKEIATLYGYPEERIIVAPPAAASLFKPHGADAVREELATMGISKGFFLAVGTLEPRKNLRTLVQAYEMLPRSVRNRAPLLVVGGQGWGKLELPAGTARLQSEGNLRFLGAVSNAELRSLYEGAIALLYPSLYEGFGMPVVEAMACGTRLVHSEHTAMDEITAGLGTRLPALDVDAWSNCLQTLVSDGDRDDGSQRLLRLGRAADFDWHQSAQIVRTMYDAIVLAKADS